jgi:nucleoside-diphosphate-sugar epimerase
MAMRVVITGASGFVGRHVVPALLAREHEVIALGRSESRLRQFDWWDNVQFVQCDTAVPLPLDLGDRLAGPVVLIHLAWSGLPNYSALFHFEDELPAQYRFLRAMIELGAQQVLVAGTCLEYGLQNGCLRETAFTSPTTSYGIAKDSLRRMLLALQQQLPFTLKWARLFYMNGPGQPIRSLFGQLDQAIKAGDAKFEMSAGEQLRDYLPVDEAARRLVRLLECPSCEGIYNVCSGSPVSVRRLVEDYLERMRSNITLELGALPYPAHEPLAFWGDVRKFAAGCPDE